MKGNNFSNPFVKKPDSLSKHSSEQNTTPTKSVTELFKQKNPLKNVQDNIKDVFDVNSIRKENETLKSLLTPEMQDAATLEQHLSVLREENNLLEKRIQENKEKLVVMDEEILLQNYSDESLE